MPSTLMEIRMRVIRMIMRATCHNEVCGTCYHEEGSLQNLLFVIENLRRINFEFRWNKFPIICIRCALLEHGNS